MDELQLDSRLLGCDEIPAGRALDALPGVANAAAVKDPQPLPRKECLGGCDELSPGCRISACKELTTPPLLAIVVTPSILAKCNTMCKTSDRRHVQQALPRGGRP